VSIKAIRLIEEEWIALYELVQEAGTADLDLVSRAGLGGCLLCGGAVAQVRIPQVDRNQLKRYSWTGIMLNVGHVREQCLLNEVHSLICWATEWPE
jgi:hypothetical protein